MTTFTDRYGSGSADVNLTFSTLKKRSAKLLKLIDPSTLLIQTGRDITEADIGQAVNDALVGDIYPEIMKRNPQYFEQTAYAPNYTTSGTVSASSTSTTLVATSAIFTLSMVGQTVYNVTDSESAVINSFTSTTTVVLDTEINDTWDTDSIRVIDQEFVLGGDLSDYYAIRWLGIKTQDTDTNYMKLERVPYNVLHEFNSAPTNYGYYITTVKETTIPKNAIGIEIGFTAAFDRAIKARYIEIPQPMSADGDLPRLPQGHCEFVKWAAVKEAAVVRDDGNLYSLAEREYEKGRARLFRTFRPTATDSTPKIRVPNRMSGSFFRRY